MSAGSKTNCENGESFLCQSGKCENGLCLPVLTNPYLPILCQEDSDCEVDGFVSTCLCGTNPNGNMFCPLRGGDEPYKQYFELNKEWTLSNAKGYCNTNRRHSFDCAADRWDRGKANQIMNFSYFVQNYVSIVEYDHCSKELFIPEYSPTAFTSFGIYFFGFAGVWLLS